MASLLDTFSTKIAVPVREEVCLVLRKAILANEFLPGDRLVETDIASRMGVSRTPVREALRMLEREGLVKRSPRGGVVVVGFASENIIEIYAIRISLEVLAAGFSVFRITDREIDEAQELVEASRRHMHDEDPGRFFRTLTDFNRVILYSCKMPRLIKLVDTYHEYLHSLRRLSLADPRHKAKVVDDHQNIVDSLRKRDLDGTREIVRKHLREALRRYQSNFPELSGAEVEIERVVNIL